MASFHRHTLGARIGIGFGTLLLAAGLSFGAAVYVGVDGQRKAAAAANDMRARVAAVQSMQVAQLHAVSSVRNAAIMSNGKAVKAEMQSYTKAMQALREQERAFAALSLGSTSQQHLDKAIALRQAAEPVVTEAIDLVTALAGEEGARVLVQKLTPVQAEWMKELRLLELEEERVARAGMASIMAANLRTLAALAAALGLALALGATFAYLLTRSVTAKLRQAVSVARQVAAGALHVQVDASGRDEAAELMQALQAMGTELSSMVRSVRVSTDTLSGAAEEISRGNLDLSARTERQAATLQQSAASLAELAEAVTLSADSTDAARALAERTASVAHAAGGAMGEIIGTMGRITQSSQRIGEIISVIDSIAFQTNILALNAAVEAARAGEQGRGFAVVAAEVRALSQRVATAASEVRTLISESVHSVEEGSGQVGGMGQTMDGLVDSASQVKRLLDEIARASQRQRTRIGEVNAAVSNIDAVTQQNAALVEEVAAAARSLVAQTHSLTRLVDQFELAPEPSSTEPPVGGPLPTLARQEPMAHGA